MTLEGDEVGSHISDALARQQILNRVTTEPKTVFGMLGGFPRPRIERLLRELVASGEIIDAGLPPPNTAYRLAPAERSDGQLTTPTTETPMAARKTVEGEQLDLIEVKDALAKVLDELFGDYTSKIRMKNKASGDAKKIRGVILEKIKAKGIKPDADGVIAFRMNGKKWIVEPGESKLRVTSEKDEQPAAAGAGDDD